MPKLRIAVICADYLTKRFPLQPLRYISEIVGGLRKLGNDVTVITNKTDTPQKNLITLKSVHLPSRGNPELEKCLDSLSPDLCLWHFGTTSALFFSPERLVWPSHALFTSPINSFTHLCSVGVKNLWKDRNETGIHILGSLTPKALLRNSLNSFQTIITESQYNRQKLVEIGTPALKLHCIPPGLDSNYREQLPPIDNFDTFTVLYMGGPLRIRGIYDLVDAMYLLNEKSSNVNLGFYRVIKVITTVKN